MNSRILNITLFVLIALTGAVALSANELGNSVSMLEPPIDGGQVLRENQYQYLFTPDGKGWDQLDQIRLSGEWQNPDVDTLNVNNAGVLWVRIPLAAPPSGNMDWRFEVRWPHVSHVDLAVWIPGRGLGEIHRAGMRVPLSQLEFAHKNIVFPLSLPQSTAATVYLRIEDPGFKYLPMMLFSAESYESHNTTRLVLFSMAFGVMSVMILYNLSLFFAVRDQMYLFYSNAVFSCLLYVLAVSGYGRLVFWADNDWLDVHASAIFAAYSFLSVTYFFRVFLDLSRYGGWILKANSFFLAGFAIALLLTATPYVLYGVRMLGPLAGLSGAAALITSVIVWRHGNSSAKYFILAWTGVSISTAFMVLTLQGHIDYHPALDYSQTASFVAEIILLSLALADRIRRQRLAKEEAQASLLRLQEQTNKELESQVELRTRELEAAMIDLKSANRELSKLTRIDSLTKVHNRRHFDEMLENEVARARRSARPLAVMMIDIDHFKAINDTFGHVVGDKCLKLVAKCISQNVRKPSDVVARYGGEEFGLVLPDTDEAGAYALAERIRIAIEKVRLIYDGKTVRMTASFGVCSRVPKTDEPANHLVKDADAGLYQAKETGRNRVAVG